MPEALDRIDRRLIAILAEEGRISWRALAERVGLSQTPVLRRVRQLEAEGYLTGYAARVDERRLGAGFSVFVSVSLERQTREALAAFEDRIGRAPEVMSCFMMTGPADYLLRVVVADLPAFEAFLAEVLTPIPGIARVSSSFALKQVVQRAAPPLRA